MQIRNETSLEFAYFSLVLSSTSPVKATNFSPRTRLMADRTKETWEQSPNWSPSFQHWPLQFILHPEPSAVL